MEKEKAHRKGETAGSHRLRVAPSILHLVAEAEKSSPKEICMSATASTEAEKKRREGSFWRRGESGTKEGRERSEVDVRGAKPAGGERVRREKEERWRTEGRRERREEVAEIQNIGFNHLRYY
ncbi:hypothetical protein L484_003378 [Morus notabilis]|uniref:Uncharacterized protein n=1 Tax=Morus notabilis TaxID=981085 RepID=W9QPW2_9ROSA|nr:hypothetical protein L484_003378 [Morus notabilis]